MGKYYQAAPRLPSTIRRLDVIDESIGLKPSNVHRPTIRAPAATNCAWKGRIESHLKADTFTTDAETKLTSGSEDCVPSPKGQPFRSRIFGWQQSTSFTACYRLSQLVGSDFLRLWPQLHVDQPFGHRSADTLALLQVDPMSSFELDLSQIAALLTLFIHQSLLAARQ